MNREDAIQYLFDKLNYAYCDNCRGIDLPYEEEYCEDCHRKYQNWGIRLSTAEDIIDTLLSK